MAGWHHRLDGRESEWTPGVGDGQGGLVCCYSWGSKESDTTEWLNWIELKWRCKRAFLVAQWLKKKKSKNSAHSTGDADSAHWVGKIPWRRKWQLTLVFLPGKSNGQRSLADYSPWVTRLRHDFVTKKQHQDVKYVSYLIGIKIKCMNSFQFFK